MMSYCFPWTRNWSYEYVIFHNILHDSENLCSLDYLGIEERRDDSNYVYEEFQSQ